jgi:hypothetical protein
LVRGPEIETMPADERASKNNYVSTWTSPRKEQKQTGEWCNIFFGVASSFFDI